MPASRIFALRSSAWALPMAAILLGGAGCASFNRDWHAAARNPASINDLQGRWQGTWVSDATGHTDKLRCLITKAEDDIYRARFHAKYHKVFGFHYTLPLKVERTAEAFHFSGQANLGWLAGGLYHYEGRADATNFFSKYTSKYDHGTFHMARPEPQY